MKVLGLFSGIGGFELGLGRAGMKTVAFCENDKKCQLVLKKHWPDIPIYDDVRTLTYEQLKADGIETIDLICGGFPCQPFSVAGKQTGEEDDRYLWPEMFRIIKEVRSTWVIGENVTGIINMALDSVLADLESEGYATQTFIIPACGINAPHRRNRVWIVAWNTNSGLQGENRKISGRENSKSGRIRNDVAHPNVQGCNGRCEKTGRTQGDKPSGSRRSGRTKDMANSNNQRKLQQKRCEQNIGGWSCDNSWWELEPGMGRVVARFSSTLDETIKDYGYENDSREKAYAKINIARREILREMWGEQCKAKPPSLNEETFSNNDFMHKMSHIRAHEKWKLGVRLKEDEELCSLWERICAKPFQETQDLQSRMLERTWEIERNEKVASSRVDRLKQLGNAVVPQIPELIGRAIMEVELNA
ncbi:MAG: DNA (cytosine-5-)-methyltransferase [Methylococcaceae bacterium]